MKWAFYILCYIACTSSLFGQKKFLTGIDSNNVVKNKYLESFTSIFDLGEQIIELNQFDESLLEALVFYKINSFRESKNYSLFVQSKPIQAIADAYVNRYQSSRFISNGTNYYKLKRVLNGIPKYIWLNYKLYDGYMHTPIVADYKRGVYYFDKESDTDLQLFYGARKPKPNEDVEVFPIEAKTYNQLADELLKKWFTNRSSQMLKGNTYQFLAVKTILDKKTVRKYGKMPKVKALFIVGGRRNNMILDDMNKE
ncbi:MAG: hypothetical protein H6586_02130 [Flavobacteriales bacterium]|nr:hypothetical protein [Flavobacteriales bacterium]